MALISGLLAPLVFSEGGHHEVALAIYLAALMASTLAVPYLFSQGANWGMARWIAVLGVWILLAPAGFHGLNEDAPALLLLLVLHLVLAGLWAFLPCREEKPATPTSLWFIASCAATILGGVIWERTGWMMEGYAGPVLAIAALNLVLVKPLRARLGSRQADLGLFVLAAGHLAVAVPIALDWRWVGPLWALFALGLAWASGKGEEASAMRKLALGMAMLTSLCCLTHGLVFWFNASRTPFANEVFIEGALTTLAWFLLARRGGPIGILAFLALELLGTLTLAFECAHWVRWMRQDDRASAITVTLVFALSGAVQWLVGVRKEAGAVRRALLAAGYGWLALTGAKLIFSDLAQASTPLRALVFLGVGGIFLVVALVAHRARPTDLLSP
jgi:hypothetical protein